MQIQIQMKTPHSNFLRPQSFHLSVGSDRTTAAATQCSVNFPSKHTADKHSCLFVTWFVCVCVCVVLTCRRLQPPWMFVLDV